MPTCYDRIAKEIDHAGGWLRFDQYMALALYAPEVGYYERPHSLHPPNLTHPTNRPELAPANPLTPPTPPSGGPIGSPTRGGDFVTAPELSPLFASALSAQLCEWFESVPARVLEFGAGTGQLAADLLQACAHAGRIPEEYAIVEISASMRERQRATIAQLAPDLAARVRWLDQLPAQIEGVVVHLLDQKLAALNPDFFSYTLTKAALAAALPMQAIAFAPRLRVVGISPGLTLPSHLQSEEQFSRTHRETALLDHSSRPEDIVAAILALVANPAITGQNLVVDGGQHLLRMARDVSLMV